MKRKVPAYVERAVLWLAGDSQRCRDIEKLMRDSAYRVGAGLINAHYEHEGRINLALSKKDRLRGAGRKVG